MSDAKEQSGANQMLGIMEAGAHRFGISTNELAEVVPIAELAPYPTSDPCVLGSISVRGVLIPVLDPLALSGLSSERLSPKIAALLRTSESIVALGMDQVIELQRIAAHKLQVIENKVGQSLINRFLLTEGGQVNILSSDALFAMEHLPFANSRRQSKETQGGRDMRPHLTFECGGVSYAIAVSDLFNTIPRRELEATDVATGPFLGKLTYHGRTIPILDMNMLVDMASSRNQNLLEVVVVHVAENRLVGLAVDRICRIEYFRATRIVAVPDRMRSAMPLIKSTHKHADAESYTLIVDADRISKLPALQGVARMSEDLSTKEPAKAPPQVTESDDIVRERNRNLVFSAGCAFAAPVQEIRDVLQMPDEVTPWQVGVPGLLGLFFFRDQMTPLIHLADYLGNSSPDDTRNQYVLVCGTDELVVGFLVDGIRGILLSEWQATSTHETGYQMVNVVDRGKSWLCPRLPLEALAKDIMQALAAHEESAA